MKRIYSLVTLALACGLPACAPRVHSSCGESTICVASVPSAFSPARIVLRAGKTVTLRFDPTAGVHGIYSSELGVDHTVIEDGGATEVTLTPRRPGIYRLRCRIFCGADHPKMVLTVVVLR